MNKRGISLLLTLNLTAVFFALGMAILIQLEGLRYRLVEHAFQIEARSMARAGLDYAAAMLRHGRWKDSRSFQSPEFSSGGSFRVQVQKKAGGGYELTSEGRCGRQKCSRKANYP